MSRGLELQNWSEAMETIQSNLATRSFGAWRYQVVLSRKGPWRRVRYRSSLFLSLSLVLFRKLQTLTGICNQLILNGYIMLSFGLDSTERKVEHSSQKLYESGEFEFLQNIFALLTTQITRWLLNSSPSEFYRLLILLVCLKSPVSKQGSS